MIKKNYLFLTIFLIIFSSIALAATPIIYINPATGNVFGSGTNNTIAMWNGTNSLTNSMITQNITGIIVAGDVCTGSVCLNSISLNETDPIWNNEKGQYYNSTIIDSILQNNYYNQSTINYLYSTLTNLYAGFKQLPTWIDNGDGTISFSNGSIALYNNPDYTGYVGYYNIIAGTTGIGATNAIPDGVTSYLVAEYNAGSPIMQIITNRDLIHQSDYVPFLTITRNGNILYVLQWGAMANGMTERINDRLVRTDRYARETGLILGEGNDRTITITNGILWYGATRLSLNSTNTATQGLSIWYHNSTGGWNEDNIVNGSYYNDVWDNGTGLITLNDTYYANVWIYRNVETKSETDAVVGHARYTSLPDALNGQPPTILPIQISSNFILVGRITFQKDATSGLVGSVWTTSFTSGSVVNHNDLANIQGGGAGEYYHLTNQQYQSNRDRSLMWSQDPVYGVVSLNGIADINQQGTLKLETKIYNKTGTISFVSYNISSDSSIINIIGGGDTSAIYDGYSVIDSNNNYYYVNYVLSSTSLELEGDATSIGTGAWKYKQPPYIDLNSITSFDEKGISFSTNNAWEWALYEPHSQTERLCFANSNTPLTEIMCVHENGNVNILYNLTADYVNAKIEATNIQNPLWLTSYNETEPLFTAENTTIWNSINDKLSLTGGTMTGTINTNSTINYTTNGIINTYANGCYQIANSTGIYWIC